MAAACELPSDISEQDWDLVAKEGDLLDLLPSFAEAAPSAHTGSEQPLSPTGERQAEQAQGASPAATDGAGLFWSDVEKQQLLEMVSVHGEGQWGAKARLLGTGRTPKALYAKWSKMKREGHPSANNQHKDIDSALESGSSGDTVDDIDSTLASVDMDQNTNDNCGIDMHLEEVNTECKALPAATQSSMLWEEKCSMVREQEHLLRRFRLQLLKKWLSRRDAHDLSGDYWMEMSIEAIGCVVKLNRLYPHQLYFESLAFENVKQKVELCTRMLREVLIPEVVKAEFGAASQDVNPC